MATSWKVDTTLDRVESTHTSEISVIPDVQKSYIDWYIREVNGMIPSPSSLLILCTDKNGNTKTQTDTTNIKIQYTALDELMHIVIYDTIFNVSGEFTVKLYVLNNAVEDVLLTKSFYLNKDIREDIANLEDRIENAIAAIPADYSDLMESIAPLFDTTTNFTKGTYVWHDGSLYVFTADHSAGGWSSSDTISAILSDDLKDLSNLVDHIDSSVQIDSYGPEDILLIPYGQDGALMKSVQVSIKPVQDLHGYSNPWPAGGGASMAQFCDNDYSKVQNGLTFTYTKANEAFSITGTNGKTDENWILFNNQDSFVCQPLTVGETYVFSHNLPAGTYSQITYYTTSSGTSSLVYLAGTGAFHSQSFTVPENFSSVRAFQIGIAAFAGTLSTSGAHFEISKTAPQTWSPYSNICPISGRTAICLMHGDGNLLPAPPDADTWASGYIRDNGTIAGASSTSKEMYSNIYIPARAGVSYTISYTLSSAQNVWAGIAEYDSSRNFITRQTNAANGVSSHQYTFNLSATTAYVRVTLRTYDMIQSFSFYVTATGGEHAINPTTYEISLPDPPGTVYGGTLDLVSGVLTVTHGIIDMGTINWSYNGTRFAGKIVGITSELKRTKGICSHYARYDGAVAGAPDKSIIFGNTASDNQIYCKDSDYSDADVFKAAVAGAQVCYELDETATYQLMAQEIISLAGINILSSNADQIKVILPINLKSYTDDRLDIVDDRLDDLETLSTYIKEVSVSETTLVFTPPAEQEG